MSEARIQAVGLTKSFATTAEEVRAVQDVDLTVGVGEFVCLMGPSGCGKSTLLSLLSGIVAPDAGTIRVEGQDLGELTPEQRANVRLRRIGVVFQRDSLVPEFSALENVMLPIELQSRKGDAAALARGALHRVGIADLADRRPQQLSGGQRQRVGIARAIVGHRSVLLADEATGSLDHGNSARMFELFAELAAQGTTVLAATHDSLGATFATRTLSMMDGRLETATVSARG